MSVYKISTAITNSTCFNNFSRSLLCCPHLQYFSAKSTYNPIKVHSDTGEKITKKKTDIIPKITLVQDNQLTITTLEEAQKISKRRNLKLVKIVDVVTKTQRPVYKLLTGAEYFDENIKQREHKKQERLNSFKGEKVIAIGQSISEHDLQTHLKRISKWIEKSYEIKVVISGNSENMEKAEMLYNTVTNAVGSRSRIVQRRQKGSDIRFQILPPKTSSIENDNSS